MQRAIIWLIILLGAGISACAGRAGAPGIDWDQWRYLPVLDGGRHKPLDSLAREFSLSVCSRSHIRDPETGAALDPVGAYLAMVLEWDGWDKPADPHSGAAMGAAAYFAVHEPDRWDRAALLFVDSAAVREALGLAGRQWISPWELSQAKIRDLETGEEPRFVAWAQSLRSDQQQSLTAFQEEALQLAGKLRQYQFHRMGAKFYVLPIRKSEHREWLSVWALLQVDLNDQTDPEGALRKVKHQFLAARTAYRQGSAEAFNRASQQFLGTVTQTGVRWGRYTNPKLIRLEVAYHQWPPFRIAWIGTLIAFVCLLVGTVTRWKAVSVAGLVALAAGLAAMLLGFAARMVISGRAPVTNLYESVVFTAFGALVIGLVFGLRHRRTYLLASACAVASLILLLADFCPTTLDPAIRPLPPVLRSNFWLAVHVITIMLSYAAFALALAISNVTLGYYLIGSQDSSAIAAQSRFIYKTLQVGILLLAAGTILGAMWADYSWGRFWGWDRKEVWALITLLGYLALVHARAAGWIGRLGLAAWSVVCFALVVMAWYGVNLMGKGGLHNYALGRGPVFYVLIPVVAELLYVAAAAARYAASKPRPAAA